MFRDCWDYICYKIQAMILKNGQNQNRKKQENINRTTTERHGSGCKRPQLSLRGFCG